MLLCIRSTPPVDSSRREPARTTPRSGGLQRRCETTPLPRRPPLTDRGLPCLWPTRSQTISQSCFSNSDGASTSGSGRTRSHRRLWGRLSSAQPSDEAPRKLGSVGESARRTPSTLASQEPPSFNSTRGLNYA